MISSLKTICAIALGAAVLSASTKGYADVDLGTVPAGVDAAYIQQLYKDAMAKGESKVVILSTDRRFAPLDEFTKRFPGIAIDNSASQEWVAQVSSEYRAGKMGTDLVEASAGVASPVRRIGGLAALDYVKLGYPTTDQIGGLAIYADSPYGNFYNTKTVKKEDLPHSYADLMDPKWQNKLVGDAFTYAAGWSFQALVNGEKPTVQRAVDLYNESHIVLTGTALDLVSSGEKSLFILGGIFRGLQAQLAGDPIGISFFDGLGVSRFGLAQTTLAPHPNAAKLFIYWIHTTEGQAALWKHSGAGLATNPDSPLGKMVRDAGVKFIFEDDSNWQERARLTQVIREAVLKK